MAVTRAQVETMLVRRRGKLMSAAGLAVSVSGANADLIDPIGYAIRRLGGSVASIIAITDTDIATVSADDLDGLLDISELRLLQNIKGNLDVVDITTGPISEKLSQLSDSLQEDIKTLTAKVEDEYGVGGTELEAGVLKMNFAEHNEDIA